MTTEETFLLRVLEFPVKMTLCVGIVLIPPAGRDHGVLLTRQQMSGIIVMCLFVNVSSSLLQNQHITILAILKPTQRDPYIHKLSI